MKKSSNNAIPSAYKSGILGRVPNWAKIAFVKWWVAGAIYYFVGFNMPSISQTIIDIVFSMGLIAGVAGAFVLYPLIKYLCIPEEDYVKFIVIRSNSPLRIIFHVMYNWVVFAMIAFSYVGINAVINAAMHYDKGTASFGAEPILFGLFYILFDMALVKLVLVVRKNK